MTFGSFLGNLNALATAFAVRAIPLAALATGAHAQVIISSGATANMVASPPTCKAGIAVTYQPTAATATLNVTALKKCLAKSNLTITTAGSGIDALNIIVAAPLSWAGSNGLSLSATDHISIASKVVVQGLGALTITTNGDTGALSFGAIGSVAFTDPASLNTSTQLTINNTTSNTSTNYTLVSAAESLQAYEVNTDFGLEVTGNFALANSYDDFAEFGAYPQPNWQNGYPAQPVNAFFNNGSFEGLGNTISHLTFNDYSVTAPNAGLFLTLASAAIADLRLVSVNILSSGSNIGGLVATGGPFSSLIGDSVSGKIIGEEYLYPAPIVGGLIGSGGTTISNCFSSATVSGGQAAVGGLAGSTDGTVSNSFSTGPVSGANNANVGGLEGGGGGYIANSYSTGKVSGGYGSFAGGLTGNFGGIISNSFAAGEVSVSRTMGATTPPSIGGLVGFGNGPVQITNSYSASPINAPVNNLAEVGGLIGSTDGSAGNSLTASYAYGPIKGSKGNMVGGLIGTVGSSGVTATNTYWDTDTSGQDQAVGNSMDYPGMTGLSTAQLQSGLPVGFVPPIWGELSNINMGLPYLCGVTPNGGC